MKRSIKNTLLAVLTLFLALSLCCCGLFDRTSDSENEDGATDQSRVNKEQTAETVNGIFSAAKDSIPASSDNRLSDLIAEIGDAGFSVGGFSGGNGSMLPSDALIFKDKTLYVLGSAVEGDSVTPMASVTKLYGNGILSISTENGVTTASISKLDTELDNKADGIADVLDALMITESDLVETDTPTKFKLTDAYAEKLEKAIKDANILSDDSDFYILSVALDTEKLESDGELSITIDRSFTDDDLLIKIAKPDSASGVSLVNLSISFGETEISLSIETHEDGTGEVTLEMTSPSEMKLTLDVCVTKSGSKDNALTVNAALSLEGTESPFTCSARLDIETKLSGALSRIAGDVSIEAQGGCLAGTLVYDASLISVIGAKPLTLDARLTEEGESEKRLLVSVLTVNSTEDAKEFALTVTDSASSEPLTAVISSPATIEPTLGETEREYLERSDLFFSDYDSNAAKMDALTARVLEMSRIRNPFLYSSYYYTVDEATGLIFFTDITVKDNYITSVTTEFVLNPDDYLYFYRKNDGKFSTSIQSGSERDAMALKNAICFAVPEGFDVMNYGDYWTYRYVEEVDLYLAIRGIDELSAIFFTEEPINATIKGRPVHKLGYDESGAVKIHSFTTEYSDDCKLIRKCTLCDYAVKALESTHNYTVSEEKRDGETLLWTLDYCDRCDEGSLVIHDTAGCTFALAVRKTASKYIPYEEDIYDEIISAEASGEENLFLIFDVTHNANEVCTGHAKLEIPAIGESCEYKLIGVTRNTKNSKEHSCEGVDALVLSDEIKFLGYSAFNSASYKNVTLPKSLVFIGNEAFSRCKSLTSIVIPEGVTVIGGAAFEYCSALTDVTLPAALESIYGSTFYKCSSLQKINLPKGITEIIDNAFYGCSALEEITIPEGCKSIGLSAFANCTSLKKISLADGLTSIGNNAFKGCTALESICVPKSVTEIGEKAFEGCTSLTAATICGNIGEYAFRTCTSLREVTVLADTETIIGTEAFLGCTSLTDITLPEEIGEISSKAFYECTSLKSVTIPGSIKSIRDNVFYGCTSLAEITVSEGITYIGSAFRECHNISTVTLPSTLTKIGWIAFWNCNSIESVYYNGSIEEWIGITFEQESSNPLFGGSDLYCNGELITDVALPEGITKVPDRAFIGCKSITSVSVPDGVTEMGWYAFADCTSLKKIVLPETLTEISPYAFRNCRALSEINLSDSITSISNNAFENCTSLSGTLSLKSLKYLGNSAFKNCTKLTELILYEGIAQIPENAFSGCTSLESIVIPTSLEYIIQYAFYSCTALKDIYYAGSSEDFEKLQIISTGNDVLSSATVHYNYSYEE